MQRDPSIDILRFIGISLIILAHIAPPAGILQIRCFDVPLMLFVSGLTMFGRKPDFSWKFLAHRAKRLLVPVYTFLTIYFLLVFIAQQCGFDFGVRKEHVIGSYLLLDGIGFVWVIRVFLMVALLTPPLIWLSNHLSSAYICLISAGIVFGLDALISANVLTDNIVVREYLYYAIGYSIPMLIALKVPAMKTKEVLITLTFFVILCVCQFFFISSNFENFNWLSFNNFKYPPQAYFLLYGIVMSLICYLLLNRCNLHKYLSIFTFIGCNTIWIYLYHIPLVQLTGKLGMPWHIRYLTVYLIAFLLCWLQVKLVNFLQSRYNWAIHLNFMKG